MAKLEILELTDLRGGRNGFDPPHALPDGQVVEALNVDYCAGSMAHRRGGAAAKSLTSSGLTGFVASAFRHLPTADETAAELWLTDSAFKIARYSAGAWAAVTPKDAITATAYDVSYASLNQKMYTGYKSAVDRLHLWDGTSHRRVGLKAPTAAPTTVLAAGAATDSRKYKTAAAVYSGSVCTSRSELSTATGVVTLAAQQATVTFAGAPSDHETHWELYAASVIDGYTVYYFLSSTTIGSTIVDNAGTVSLVTGTVAPVTGVNTIPWSAKYVLADENRLLFAGSFETAGYASRVGFTAISGSTDVGDDERYPSTTTQKNYIDLDRGDGGGITGMGGPINGSPYIFKLSQIYKLVRTGIAAAPYLPVTVSKSVGCLRHQTIACGEDEDGNPAVYFLSREGPCRLGARGLQPLVNDVRDIWKTVNLAATTVVGHAVYHPDEKQYWVWVATGSSNVPDTRIVFDVRRGRATVGGVRGGWAKHTGESCKARCSAMLPVTFGATQTIALRPHIGYDGTAVKLWACDTDDLDDGGTTFQAYIKTKPYALAHLGRNYGITEMHLLAKALAATTVYCSVIRDFGLETRVFSTSIAPVGSEERVLRQFEDAAMGQAGTIQFQIGDSAAGAIPQWTLEALAVRFTLETADR